MTGRTPESDVREDARETGKPLIRKEWHIKRVDVLRRELGKEKR